LLLIIIRFLPLACFVVALQYIQCWRCLPEGHSPVWWSCFPWENGPRTCAGQHKLVDINGASWKTLWQRPNPTLSPWLGVRESSYVRWCIAVNRKAITELWSITCHMGSHSVSCYL